MKAAESADYPERKRRNQAAAIHLAQHMAEVPVLLFVAGWTRRGQPQTQALFPCVQNLLLACRAVGLGASLTTLHRGFGEECDRWLGLPEGCPTCALLPIGWPRGKYGTPPRRPVDECLFFERYDPERDPDSKRVRNGDAD
jgi:nitroreductase